MTPFDNLWHLLTTYDNLWQLMTTYDTFWQLLTPFDSCWQLLTTVGNCWQLLTNVETFWQLLTTVDNKWWQSQNHRLYYHTTYMYNVHVHASGPNLYWSYSESCQVKYKISMVVQCRRWGLQNTFKGGRNRGTLLWVFNWWWLNYQETHMSTRYRVIHNISLKIMTYCSQIMSLRDFQSLQGAHHMWSIW